MITFFTIPKPFVGHIGDIQKKAIQSWKAISNSEVLLFGDEIGMENIAWELDCKHIPDVKKSSFGTPYLDDAFSLAQSMAKYPTLCYVNCDILLYNSLVEAVNGVSFPEYLMTGARTNNTDNFPGMDYFVFPKKMKISMLPFIVGRRGWDNWLIWYIRSRNILVIDATDYINAIHQDHDYSHVPESSGERWEACPESEYNLNLVGNKIIYLWEIHDADYGLSVAGTLDKKSASFRSFTQGLILTAPKKLHPIMEPVYRVGHVIKYGYLKIRA